MGNLVFQATLGGQVNLVGPNTASTFNLNVPATSSTLATLTGTETLTNKTLTSPTLTTPVLGTPSSGTLTNCTGLPNAGLVNSSVTIGGTAIALGGSSSTITNDLSISGLTVGKGYGALAYNTALGITALGSGSLTGNYNTAVGYLAGSSNTSGAQNTFTGRIAGSSNTIGSFNAAFGDACLNSNTTGSNNTSVGQGALTSNTTASNNTAVGYQAGYSNTTGTSNISLGYQAGYSTTTTNDNTALGQVALYNNQGTENTAVGSNALNANTSGGNNSAFGRLSLWKNTTGSNNTAYGHSSLFSNTTASNNTAVGYQAGYTNSTNTAGVFLGYQAGYLATGDNNTFVGLQSGYRATGGTNTFIGVGSGGAVTSGAKNTIIGSYNGNQGGLDIRTANNYIVLSDGDGNPRGVFNSAGYLKAMPNQADVLNIGGSFHELVSNDDANNTLYVSNKSTNTTTNGMMRIDAFRNTTNNTFYALGYFNQGAGAYKLRIADSGNVTNTNGSYGTISDSKNKENIVDATPKLDKLNQLQVRNFNFKGDELKQIGFVAQEFEQVFPSMVEEHKETDGEGNDLGTKTKSIKTSVLVPILVKAIQELNAKVEAQAAEIAELKAKVA